LLQSRIEIKGFNAKVCPDFWLQHFYGDIHMGKAFRYLLMVCMVGVLSACGGDSVNDVADTPVAQPPVVAPPVSTRVGTYAGAVTNQGLRWCIDRPLDAGHGQDNCGLVYQLGGSFNFYVDGNNRITGDTYLYGNYMPVCQSNLDPATGNFTFTLCWLGLDGGGLVMGEGNISADGVLNAELWETCCRFKTGFLNARRQ
jgi:hypothetical protein